MPTAIPFTALGRGNGFPFCLDFQELIDLNGDIWDRTQPISLNSLMSLFWNLYEINSLSFTFDFTTSRGVTGSEEYTNKGSVSYSTTALNGLSGEPYKRVCFTSLLHQYNQVLESSVTSEPVEDGSFSFLPTLDDNDNYCLAYSIDAGEIMSPRLAAAQSVSTHGGVVDIQLPLDDEGNTTVIKIVGLDFLNDDTTTATGGAITSSFYTYT
jgi:hypothetical protein